jgi:RHS repeat-associated protein
MKRKLMMKPLLLAGLLVGIAPVAQAFYNPSTGRWLSRDPLGEPGFEVFRGRSPSLLAGGSNRYVFVGNSPLDYIDYIGLDVWIIKESSGMIRHRWVIGSNADGTYWSSDFGPTAQNLIARACCKGAYTFHNNSIFDPKNLWSEYVVERHVKANQLATDQAKKWAQDPIKHKGKICCENKNIYVVGLNDCRDWAKEVADQAEWHQNNCFKCNPDPRNETGDGEGKKAKEE